MKANRDETNFIDETNDLHRRRGYCKLYCKITPALDELLVKLINLWLLRLRNYPALDLVMSRP